MNANVNAAFLNAGQPVAHQAADLLARWRRRAADRRNLARLDDFMLRDIGLARADVEKEISKPFWRG